MARHEWEEDFIRAAEKLGKREPAARAARVHPDTVRYQMRRDENFRARVEKALGVRRLVPVLLVCLFGLSSPLAATITSAPVDLGSAGLTVTVGLRHWQEDDPDEWPAASTAGITINDLGGGLYTASGLPAAVGTERYALQFIVGGSGAAQYVYGAQPGTRVVWREEIELPSPPLKFKQGDTYGSISMVVTRNLPAAVCEPETEATMTAVNAQTAAVLFEDEAVVISDCELDATTGTYGATFTYDLQAGDTDTVAKYIAETTICYAPASCQTLPSDNTLRFEVVTSF